MSTEPDFLICINCDTPTYNFEWSEVDEKPTTILCAVCGNDEPEDFITEAQFEEEEG